MKSLAARFRKFVSPNPKDIDPEDDGVLNSSTSGSENEEARAHYLDVGKSALRHDEPNIDTRKYSSARTSRKTLEKDDSSDSAVEQDELASDSDSDEVDGIAGVDESEDDDEELDQMSVDEDDSQESDTGASDDDSEVPEKPVVKSKKSDASPHTGAQSAVAALLQQEQKELISRLSTSTNQDADKGKAVNAQMKIYEGLLDARISLQKAVSGVHGDVENPKESLDAVCELIAEIQTIRNKLDGKSEVCRKRSLSELADATFEMDQQLAKRRENVLSKWSRKVQLSSGSNAMQGTKFKSLNQSSARQVEGVLADMDRLLKRTQVNRSQYTVNGVVPDHSDQIFDDTDFYRLLLTDLVDRRMAENANGDKLKWTVAKSKQRKAKDTGASKGRRLRYDVQDKIVSFDAPRPTIFKWSETQAEDLFASLLGVNITMDDREPEEGDEAVAEEVDVNEFNLFG